MRCTIIQNEGELTFYKKLSFSFFTLVAFVCDASRLVHICISLVEANNRQCNLNSVAMVTKRQYDQSLRPIESYKKGFAYLSILEIWANGIPQLYVLVLTNQCVATPVDYSKCNCQCWPKLDLNCIEARYLEKHFLVHLAMGARINGNVFMKICTTQHCSSLFSNQTLINMPLFPLTSYNPCRSIRNIQWQYNRPEVSKRKITQKTNCVTGRK